MADTTKVLKVILEAVDNASGTLKSFQGKADELAGRMTKAGGAMIALGAAPTAGLVGATKAAIDFEDSFAGVRKTVDASEAEFAQLSQNFRNISKVTPLAIGNLNRIGEIAGSLGISGVANLTKFTETIAKIGITTNLTEEEAAMSFGRIVNIMQEPIKNVDRMGATVVDLGNKFASTERDITEFSERIAGAGKIAGLSTANIFAIGTAMSSVGIEAEAGGTAVQKVLISMYQAAAGSTSEIIDNSKAIATNTGRLADIKKSLEIATQRQSEFGEKTKESARMANAAQIEKYNREITHMSSELGALNATHGQAAISANGFAKVLGVTNKEFEKMFKSDPSAVFEKFVLKLGEISKKGGDAAGVLEELELGDQRLIRSFLSLSNAGDLLTQTLTVGDKAWQNNAALQTEAEKRYATTSSQIQIAKNNLYDLGITIGTFILPALNQMIQGLKPIIERVAAFAQEHPKLTTGLLIAGAAVAALGAVLVTVGMILPGIIAAFGLLSGAIGVTIAIVGAIIAVIGAPLLVGIAAVVATVIALQLAWSNNWFGIQTITNNVIAFIKRQIKMFTDFVDVDFVGFLKNFMLPQVINVLDAMSGGWIKRFNSIKDAIFGVIGAIGSLIDKARDMAGKVSGGLKIPGFQHGGFVAGIGTDAMPAFLHPGERVIPRNGTDVNPSMGGGSGGVTINITGSFNLDSPARVDELANKIIRILGRQNELAGKGIGI